MKVIDQMRFPHPVLWDRTGDYRTGSFEFAEEVTLIESADGEELLFSLSLSNDDLSKLHRNGDVALGVNIVCEACYLDELHPCKLDAVNSIWITGRRLCGLVRVRPIAWCAAETLKLNSQSLNDEYAGAAIETRHGAILAIGEERLFYVGNEKLQPLSSVVDLELATEMNDLEFEVDIEGDRIAIRAGKLAHERISILRGSRDGKPFVLNAVYLSVMQAVLGHMASEGSERHEGKSWHRVIHAKLIDLGCDVKRDDPLLLAQRLLHHPIRKAPQQD